MTVCVLRDSGVQIAHCLVTAKMEHPALPMTESVSARRDSEALLAREVRTNKCFKTSVPLSFTWNTYNVITIMLC